MNENESTALTPFGEPKALQTTGGEVGAVTASTQATEMIRAQMAIAQHVPRNEATAYQRLMESMKRLRMAEVSMYRYPRGGTEIIGPSVKLAREGARLWGNIRFGIKILSEDENYIHVCGYALDAETNTYVDADAKFKNLILRKEKGWIKPDEREKRELINKHGAICVRNAILQILPPDFIEDAQEVAKETMNKEIDGTLKANRKDATKWLLRSFADKYVTAEMLTDYIGCDLFMITTGQYMELRGILQSLIDGNTKREDHFDLPKPKSARETATIDINTVKPGKPTDKPKQTAPKTPATPEPTADSAHETACDKFKAAIHTRYGNIDYRKITTGAALDQFAAADIDKLTAEVEAGEFDQTVKG